MDGERHAYEREQWHGRQPERTPIADPASRLQRWAARLSVDFLAIGASMRRWMDAWFGATPTVHEYGDGRDDLWMSGED